MSNLTKPPILDDTGQTIKTKLTAILQALQNAGNVFIPKTQKGAASGVAELDSNGKVPTGQIPTLSQYMVKGTDYVTAGLQSGETVGNNTTVEGFNNKGRGDYNHIEGSNNGDNLASRNVHIEGEDNAIGGSGQYGLHIEGKGNDGHYAANYAHIGGKYANVDSINGADWAYLVGNGTADNSRSNAFGVTWDGDAIAGRSNGVGNNRKLATGADVISYLNSNVNPQKITGSGMSIYSEWDIVTVNFNGHSAINNEELNVPFSPTANIFTLALIESTGTIIRIGITSGKKLLLRSISDGSTINSATITGSITYIATV